MKKYVVATYDHWSCEMIIEIINSEDDRQAVYEAVCRFFHEDENSDTIKEEIKEFTTEQIIEYMEDSDRSMSYKEIV